MAQDWIEAWCSSTEAYRDEAIETYAELSEIDREIAEVAWDDLSFDRTIDQGYVDDTQMCK